MLLSKLTAVLAILLPFTTATAAMRVGHAKRASLIAPKVFIISMFEPEAEIWYGIKEFDLLAQNITVTGFSPLFPDAHCTADGQICQMVTGEGEINAAVSVNALVLSPSFDLTKTYFMIAGIAGVNPEVATTASVTFARYAVQVALQSEFDAREIPANFSTGYVPQKAHLPSEYPQSIYGTEVFEVSEALRQIAIGFASTATLNDTVAAQAYRARYASISTYAAGASSPKVVACDVATSDVYFSGALLGSAFGNTTRLFTNGSGIYCTSAQEDNATLESLLRGALNNLTDFSRIIIMRTASDFDRPPPGESAIDNLLYISPGAFQASVLNIYRAGVNIVSGIVSGWNATFAAGVSPGNYVGDIFGSLGGRPDYGLPSHFLHGPGAGSRKRGLGGERWEGNMRMKRKAEAIRRGFV